MNESHELERITHKNMGQIEILLVAAEYGSPQYLCPHVLAVCECQLSKVAECFGSLKVRSPEQLPPQSPGLGQKTGRQLVFADSHLVGSRPVQETRGGGVTDLPAFDQLNCAHPQRDQTQSMREFIRFSSECLGHRTDSPVSPAALIGS